MRGHSPIRLQGVLITVLCVACALVAYQVGRDRGQVTHQQELLDLQAELEQAARLPPRAKASTIQQIKVSAPDAQESSQPAGQFVQPTAPSADHGSYRIKQDPLGSLLAATAAPNAAENTQLIQTIASEMSLDDVKEGVVLLEELPLGPHRTKLESALTQRWAALDPLQAMSYAQGVAEPKRRHDLKREVLQAWAAQEPLMALEYAKINPDDLLSSERFNDIFSGVKQADPETMFFFLENLDDLKTHSGRVQELVWESYNNYPDEMVRWTESLPSGDLKDQAFNRVLDHMARYDPLRAKQWMEQQVEAHYILPANIELGESWARVDPHAATDWALSLPDDQQDGRIMEKIYYRWQQYNRKEAEAWLSDQPPSKNMDRAIEVYVRSALRRNPADAFSTAQSITDKGRRDKALKQAAYYWQKSDKKGFSQHVQGSDSLAPEFKQRWLKQNESSH